MSNLIDHANYELNRAGLFDNDADYGGAPAKAVMDLVEVFDQQGHSGMSAAITLRLFYDLAEFKPIGPITSDSEEWGKSATESGRTSGAPHRSLAMAGRPGTTSRMSPSITAMCGTNQSRPDPFRPRFISPPKGSPSWPRPPPAPAPGSASAP